MISICFQEKVCTMYTTEKKHFPFWLTRYTFVQPRLQMKTQLCRISSTPLNPANQGSLLARCRTAMLQVGMSWGRRARLRQWQLQCNAFRPLCFSKQPKNPGFKPSSVAFFRFSWVSLRIPNLPGHIELRLSREREREWKERARLTHDFSNVNICMWITSCLPKKCSLFLLISRQLKLKHFRQERPQYLRCLLLTNLFGCKVFNTWRQAHMDTDLLAQ